MDGEALLERARAQRAMSYAPYSGFRVGAALLADDGSVHVGSNVENASYGLSQCAERSAVTAAVSAGHRAFRAIALSSDADRPIAPCGACRQVLVEFAPDLRVISEGGGTTQEWSLSGLQPEAFREVPGPGRGTSEG